MAKAVFVRKSVDLEDAIALRVSMYQYFANMKAAT